ncbi:MAG: hybrid sensor histidine kinase/response regulator [bacterium]|jgi:two-component system sensor histidine kinase/response regulator
METDQESHGAADILIVDDTPANLQFLAALLKMKGYKTRAALNGELALLAIQTQPPDLILLDVHMPDIDGIEVCRRIKANPAFSDIPVIFVSGEHKALHKIKAFSSGGVDFVTRPFQIDEVLSRVSIHLDLRKQREQLRATMKRMQTLEALRDNLIHMIVHDLRNPLGVIDGYLELIKSEKVVSFSPKVANYLSETQAHTRNMVDMINSILDINRMENGTLILNLMPCDLVDLCGQVITSMEPIRQSRSLRMATGFSPIHAMIDIGLIRRVLTNLIANAIRATRNEDGQITLSATTINDFIRINITDNGRPITVEEHSDIFEKYAQANSALSGKGRYAPGLGLPFCKLAVEAHGGRVGIEHAPDASNVFWFELPLAGPRSRVP